MNPARLLVGGIRLTTTITNFNTDKTTVFGTYYAGSNNTSRITVRDTSQATATPEPTPENPWYYTGFYTTVYTFFSTGFTTYYEDYGNTSRQTAVNTWKFTEWSA